MILHTFSPLDRPGVYHFEQLGWSEPQVVVRFWIIAVVLALAGLATLKLR